MDQNKLYVTRLMYAECDLGTMKNKLNLPLDHGIIYGDQDHPVMNANDHVSNKHIVHFGRCQSDKNPGNTINLESMVMSVLIPGSSLIKKLIGCDGCKCQPMTLTPWIKTHRKHSIDGAPALLLESTASCFFGGTIRIILEETEEETKQTDPGDVEQKKHILEYLPASMQNKIDDFCSQPNVTASPTATEAATADAAAFSAAMGGNTGGAGNGVTGVTGGSVSRIGTASPAMAAGMGKTSGGLIPGGGFNPSYGAALGDWTERGIAFGAAGIPRLNFTPEMSLQNLIHNQAQTIMPNALDALGNIVNTRKLDCFNIGSSVLSAVDPGCSALFNALNMLGNRPDLADIIFHFEQYALNHVLPVGGPLISSAASMTDYLTKKDIKTDLIVRTGTELNDLVFGKMPPFKNMGMSLAQTFVPADFMMRQKFLLPENGIVGIIPGGGQKPSFQAIQPSVLGNQQIFKNREVLAPAKPQLVMSLQKK